MKYLITTIAAVLLVGCGPRISIYEAAKEGNIEAVKQHLAAGTDVNAKQGDVVDAFDRIDRSRTTPLHEAIWGGHVAIAELLISKGANVNAKDNNGLTPMHWAETKEIAEVLIANGADVNTKWKGGLTYLHQAAVKGRNGVAELLIGKGLDVNAKDEDGDTPLDWANGNGNRRTADLLRKHGGKTGAWFKADESIHIASEVGNTEAVKQHLAAGADVNAKDEHGITPLLHATRGCFTEIVELLIASGANVNVKSDGGEFPLLTAITCNTETVKILIAKGADINTKNEWGDTSLDIAIEINHKAMADLLRKHGAKTAEELKAEGK